MRLLLQLLLINCYIYDCAMSNNISNISVRINLNRCGNKQKRRKRKEKKKIEFRCKNQSFSNELPESRESILLHGDLFDRALFMDERKTVSCAFGQWKNEIE